MNQTLLELAQSVERDSERTDRFMRDVAHALRSGAGGVLSDRERTLMCGVLTDIVGVVATDVADRFVSSTPDPALRTAVTAAVAPDGDAAPSRIADLLHASGVLDDPRLIRLVYARMRAHRLAEIMRLTGGGGASTPSASAADVQAEELPAEALLDPGCLALLRHEEMQRLDRYGDPRLPVEHLPPDLHDALYWHVAAALRGALLKGGAAEAGMLDDIIETTVADRLRQPRPLREIDRLDRAAVVPHATLVRALARGEIFLFQMLLGQISGLTLGQVQQIAFGRGEVEFATVCRALEVPRGVFAELYLLTRQHSARTVRDPQALSRALRDYDAIDPDGAAQLLRLWRRHPRYVGAIGRVTAA